MIQSMTGYGSAEYSNESYSANLEIKGYNNRYLDIKFSLPSTLGRFEEEFRSLIKQQCTRGRLEVQLNVQHVHADVSIDPEKLRALKEALGMLKKALRLPGRVRIDHLLEFDGLITLEGPFDSEALRPLLHELLEAGLADFVKSRRHEGEETVKDLLFQLDRISTALEEIQKQAPNIERHINDRLSARFEEVLGTKVDEDRVLAELAALLVKHSINEEITRLISHTGQFKQEIQNGGALGKRLDFICQEINREVNTIASKNIIGEIPVHIIDMKDALENIREQLRNIE